MFMVKASQGHKAYYPLYKRTQRKKSTWKIATQSLHDQWIDVQKKTLWKFRKLNRNRVIGIHKLGSKPFQLELKGNISHEKKNIEEFFHSATPDELNSVLSCISEGYPSTILPYVLRETKPKVQKNIFHILTISRLEDIDIFSRAQIIKGIQELTSRPLPRHGKSHLIQAVNRIILQTRGKDLTYLKEFIGIPPQSLDGSDIATGDLFQLIYSKQNIIDQMELLQHISREGQKCREEIKTPLIKIVSDIDDTIYAGWLDKRFPLHSPYPGVFQLFDLINFKHKQIFGIPPQITFLTARPKGPLSVGKKMTAQQLQSVGIANPAVIHGTIKDLRSIKQISKAKFQNFRKFSMIFPEYDYVFFGDSGQGDALLAQWMINHYPNKVKGAFIHNIDLSKAYTGDGSLKSQLHDSGIVLFSNYTKAAFEACKKNLISVQDLHEFGNKALEELMQLDFPESKIEEKHARINEIEEDIKELRKLGTPMNVSNV